MIAITNSNPPLSSFLRHPELNRYVSELHRKATANGNNILTRDQMYQTFRDLRMAEQGFDGGFDHLLDRLNNQNYLLMKGSGRYQLTTQ